MKSRMLFISLAVVLALSVGFIGCDGENGDTPPEVILVGLARDIDGGPLGVFECGYGGAVYRWFIDEVNADGGIVLSDYGTAKVPVELVVRDFDVMTWDIGTVTEALILTDKVDFIWGGPGTDCIFTQAPICNLNGIPLITLEGGASSMIWDGDIDNWPYVWVSLSFSNWNQIPVLQDMMETAKGDTPVAYMTHIGGMGLTHGLEYAEETITQFGAPNVIDAGSHSYDLFDPANEGEAAAIIAAAKVALNSTGTNDSYDIFCAWTYPWNVAALTLALMGSNFDPPAIIFGPGANGAAYVAGFGPYVNGVSCFVVAMNTTPALTDMYAGIAAQVEADWADPNVLCSKLDLHSGWDGLDYWGHPCYVAALELWEMAIEDAGNINPLDVRDSLASLNTTTVLGANTWFTVFGGGLGGGILAYECHPGEIGQWQSFAYEIVGGISPTDTFDYPNTGNWFWLLD